MVLAVLVLVGCGGVTDDDALIVGGDYEFFTLQVDDDCLDGALEALFMPEGRDVPHPFEYPIYVPGPSDTPMSYDVDFREPFVGMPVTVTTDGDGLQVRGSVMEAVQLDPSYGDCVATMVVDVDLEAVEEGVIRGDARIEVSDPRGDDGLCPVFDSDPCQVGLQLEALLVD